jgi:hypothetical protein
MTTHGKWRWTLFAAVCLSVSPALAHAQKQQRDVITREELQRSAQKDLDLFQAVRSLRPRFFEGRPGARSLGGSRAEPIVVYVGHVRLGGIDALKTVPVSDVEEVRYLDPTQAESEFGSLARGGAIVVKLHKESEPPK